MRRHFVTIIGLFFILLAPSLRAASSCPLDSVLTFNIDSLLTEVTIYDYVVDTPRTTVWTVDPQTGTRTGKSREESFSSALKELTATYVWENNTWKGTNKVVKAYQKFAGVKKQISETTFIWLNGAWVADNGFKNDYDDAARETEHFEYHRNTTTNKLEPTSGYRYEWIDDTQKSLEEIYTTFSNGAWSAGTKKEWRFDEEGRQTLYAYYGSMVNGLFIGESKEEWGFTNGVQTMHATYVWADVEWAGVLKEVLVNDSLGRATLHETYDWYNSDWSMTLREIAAFDEAGHQTLIEHYTGANGVPTGIQKEEYTYAGGDTIIQSISYKWSASKKDWVGSSNERWEFNGPSGEKTYYEKKVWRNNEWGDSILEIWEFNGPDGKQTLHEKYSWNKDAASLLKTLEYTDEYDSEDHLIRKENYTFTNGVRKGVTYYTYTYVNGKKTDNTVYTWDAELPGWIGDKKETWEFNGPNNKQTRHEKFIWQDGEWTTSLLEITNYSGTIATHKEKYELIGGVLVGTQKEIYTYDGSKKIEAITYDWVDEAWLEGMKETWNPSSTKPTLHEQFIWSNGWVKTLQENTTYDGTSTNKTLVENYALIEGIWTGTDKETWAYSGGQITKHEQYAWESEWVKTLEENTTYDGSNKVLVENYALIEGAWAGTEKETWTYTGGQLTKHEKYGWESDWVKTLEENTVYEGGNKVLVENYALIEGAWAGTEREIWHFENGYTTLHEIDEWYNNRWSLTLRDIAAFDEEGNQTLVENYTGSEGVVYANKKEEYTFANGEKIQTIIYSIENGVWVYSTKNDVGYRDGNTVVSAASYVWNGSAWRGAGDLTYTTYDDENRVVELLKKVWSAAAMDWINSTINQNTYNDEGVNIMTYNAQWDGTQWVMSSMSRLDIIKDDEGRQLLNASWQCGANGVWKGISIDTTAYSASGKPLYHAYFTSWKNNNWTYGTGSYEVKYEYDANENLLLQQRYQWKSNRWQGQYKYEYEYDDQGRQTVYAYYDGWNTSYNNWTGNTRTDNTYNSNGKIIEQTLYTTYSSKNKKWIPTFGYTYLYDEQGREIEKISRVYVEPIWYDSNRSTKEYSGNNLVKSNEYIWKNNQWVFSKRSELYYDEDVQAKLRREITGSWNNGTLASFDNKYYSYACDPMTIRFVNYDGTLLEKKTVYKGDIPEYTGETPTRTDAANTYVFLGWTPAIVPANGNATYTATFSSSMNQYTVIFQNEDGTELSRQTLYHGATPTCAEPTKQATAEYTYTFAGWSPAISTVAADITYTATYTATKNKYTITWLDDDNSLLGTTTVEYGVTPAHANPTKQATKEYSYTFAAWTPALVPVIGDATYTATYTGTKKSYTITWLNDDNSQIDQTTVEYGVVPTHANPADKTNTAQYSYSFAGWTPTPAAVKGDATYKASFIETLNRYTVTFKDEQGNVLDSRLWDYGLSPYCTTPTKDQDEQYVYIFAGWSPAVKSVTKDATYTATFTSVPKSVTIIWLNDDNTPIDTAIVDYGIVPTHDVPTKAADAEYTYTFSAWSPKPVAATENATYTATYKTTKNKYTITWLNEDNSLIGTTNVEYGIVPTHTSPTKAADEEYFYTFAGWSPEVVAVTGTATYKATFTATKKSFTITWLNDDNSLIGQTSVVYGVVPTHAFPTKAATAEWTYTFAGWDITPIAATEDATYKATYTQTKNSYTITWLNDDNSLIDQTTVQYGIVPTHTDPTKAATTEWTYTFAGWNVTPVAVTGDATYQATYTQTKNSYTITWLNDDNSLIGTTTVEYGIVPTHEAPEKDNTAQYSYTFDKWTPTPVAVVGNATYTATYSSTVNQYTVTFKDENGTVLDSRLWDYGATPTCTEPTKPATAEYTYSFAGWSPAVVSVTGETSYTATYSSTVNPYTVTFKDEDGTVLDSRLWDYNATPTCTEPSKDATAEYTYTFAGWSPEVAAVTGNATYTATYSATKNSYTITWLDDEGTEIGQTTVEYGLTPAHANIEKESTAEYTYSFAGWSPTIVPVTGDATYQATFTASKRSYLITFYYENGTTILDQVLVEYGVLPATSLIPSSPSDAHYSYTFAGWAPEVVPVTGEASYVATYTAIPNKYTITFKNYNGRVLERTKVEYGATPEYEGETPFRPATASCVYEFAGWSPEIVEVIGDATYTAVFEAIINTYTIIFYDEDGITELDRTIVEHGQKPTTEVVPTKPEDEEFTYTFAGWNPKIVKATADASYVATYTATPKTTPEGVSNVDAASEQVTKVIIDGQIFILRGAHTYSIDGVLVR